MQARKTLQRATAALGLLLVIFLGVGLRGLALPDEAAWGDEALTAVCFPAASFSAYLERVFEEDSVPRLAPVYYGLQYGWSRLFGGQLLSLRCLSIFLSALAAFQLYGLVRGIGGHRGALWAVFFYCVSLFEIYYAQEVRFYTLMNVFALAAMQGSVWYGRGRPIAGLTLALAGNAGLVGTHAFGVLLPLILCLYMLREWREPRRLLAWWGAHGVFTLAYLGWLSWLRYDFGGQSTAYGDRPAGWRELAATFLQFSGGRFSNLNPSAYLPAGVSFDVPIAVIALGLAGGAIVAVRRTSTKGEERDGASPRQKRHETLLLLLCLAAPTILLFVIGQVWRPCFFARYVVYSALPLYALMGIGLDSIPWKTVRRGIGALLVLLLAWQVLALPRPFRADYGAVRRAVEADPADRRVALALKPFNHRAVAHALRDSGVQAELLYGLKEVAGISIQRASEGVSVRAVFYRWDDLAAFEDQMDDAGMAVTRFTSAGMPPLTVYHVTAARPGQGSREQQGPP